MSLFDTGFNYQSSPYGSLQGMDFGMGNTAGTDFTGSLATNNNSLFNTGQQQQSSFGLGNGVGGMSGGAQGLGLNLPTAQLGLSGLASIGNLWGAFQSNKLANSQFNYAKQVSDTNLANQMKSYNTALSDRATSRASVEGWDDAQTQDYINKNSLSK
ncbi:putative structural protein [Erwinia phage vB_EamP_Rexella]|uniref:Putative structural protein n=1 Tax=Erwinia phage vB_EamP_Rexella TaxID=1852642 RepID=A0A191ZD33_9CAUD|nr:putative structural protein [Erwinia phage vB_EamP_Rexella]